MSPHALAAFLGLAVQTIYNRHSSGGDLPSAIKLGNRIRFRSEDVDAWLDAKRQSLPTQTTMPTTGRPIQRRERRRSSLIIRTVTERYAVVRSSSHPAPAGTGAGCAQSALLLTDNRV
nr:helix-turn-helix domain-containing protein [Caballeronia sp. NK8]